MPVTCWSWCFVYQITFRFVLCHVTQRPKIKCTAFIFIMVGSSYFNFCETHFCTCTIACSTSFDLGQGISYGMLLNSILFQTEWPIPYSCEDQLRRMPDVATAYFNVLMGPSNHATQVVSEMRLQKFQLHLN